MKDCRTKVLELAFKKSKKWTSVQIGISIDTMKKRVLKGGFKPMEENMVNKIYEETFCQGV